MSFFIIINESTRGLSGGIAITKDAEIGSFTWNQLSGLAVGLAGLVMIWYSARSQPQVSPEEDEIRGADLELASV